MRIALFIPFIAFVALLPLASQAATEQRTLPEFKGIEIRGSANVTLRQRPTQAVSLTADDSVLAQVETSVADRDGRPVLSIGMRDGSHVSGRRVEITIDLPSLASIGISGRGDVHADGFKIADLELTISGAGNINMSGLDASAVNVRVSGLGDIALAGQAKSLALAVSGKGDYEGASLSSDSASIAISGLGKAEVGVVKTLDASISGMGKVTYSGSPTVNSHVSGIGKVDKS